MKLKNTGGRPGEQKLAVTLTPSVQTKSTGGITVQPGGEPAL